MFVDPPPSFLKHRHDLKSESHPKRWWNGGIPSDWRECCVHSEQLEVADHCRVPSAVRILHFPDDSFQSGMSLLILTHSNALCVNDSSRRLSVSSAWTLAMPLSVHLRSRASLLFTGCLCLFLPFHLLPSLPRWVLGIPACTDILLFLLHHNPTAPSSGRLATVHKDWMF